MWILEKSIQQGSSIFPLLFFYYVNPLLLYISMISSDKIHFVFLINKVHINDYQLGPSTSIYLREKVGFDST